MTEVAKMETGRAPEIPVKQRARERGQMPILWEDMDRMFDRFLEGFGRRGWLQPFSWELPRWADLTERMEGRLPHVDVIDRDEEVLVRAELPGVDKKDLDVSMTETALTIRGQTHRKEEEEHGQFHRCEIVRGEFTRTVALPAEVDGTHAKAQFQDGLLEITLPKLETAKRHTIKVE
jgi:HSP20 family protein